MLQIQRIKPMIMRRLSSMTSAEAASVLEIKQKETESLIEGQKRKMALLLSYSGR